MRAAVFYGPPGSWPEKPMRIEEKPEPIPGSGEVLIKVVACGLCHTDLEYLKGPGYPPKAPPLILGHEPSGIIEELGINVEGFHTGQRVIAAIITPCQSCYYCRNGKENLCPNVEVIGATRDGAFAEYVVVPARSIFTLPQEIPLEESCIITDAVATCYHAIYDLARVSPGNVVAVYGASGGLGLVCVQILRALGAHIIGIGRKRWKLEKAKLLGAHETISVEEVDRLDRSIKALAPEGVDISIDVSGIPGLIETACRTTRPGGKIVVAGFSFQKLQLDINRLTWHELQIMGSRNYHPRDMSKAIRLVEKGVVNLRDIISHKFSLEEINEAYLKLERGEMLRGIVVL